jgi:hypothetical protein
MPDPIMDRDWNCPVVAEGLVFGKELQLLCRWILRIGWVEDEYSLVRAPFEQLVLREGPGVAAASRLDKKVESNVTAATLCASA